MVFNAFDIEYIVMPDWDCIVPVIMRQGYIHVHEAPFQRIKKFP
ncbi:MAG: hypothetical protein ACFE9D_09695 [Promethearchaeota archaeon]